MGSATATRLGDVLNDAYELHELVGAHDTLEIYRATERKTRQNLRVKMLRPEFALQGATIDRFLRVARKLKDVSDPGLSKLRIDTDDLGIPFIVEDAADGRALDELIAQFRQGMPLDLVTLVLRPLVSALTLLHDRGLVHGALDGLRVRFTGGATAPAPKLIELDDALGARKACAPEYRAPELTVKAAPTTQGDVFAVGVLLYRMLSGELPFRGSKRSAQPLDEVAPQVPQAWVELVAACLEPDPKRRIADGKTLGDCLRTFSADRQSSLRERSEIRPKQVSELGFEDTAPDDREEKLRQAKEAAELARVKISVKAAAAKPASVRESPLPAQLADVWESAPAAAKPAAAKPAAEATASPLPPQAAELATARTEFAIKAPTLSAVAAAFGGMSDEESTRNEPAPEWPSGKIDKKAIAEEAPGLEPAKDRKSIARETAEKLSAKVKPRDSQAEKAPEKKPEARPEAKSEPEAVAAPARASLPAPAPKPAPLAAATQVAARSSEVRVAAFAHADAQLEAMRAAADAKQQLRERWLGLSLLVPFLAVLQLGVPFLYEPSLASAQALLGSRLQLVLAGFALLALLATARLVFLQIKAGSLAMRAASAALFVVTGCVCALGAQAWSDAAAPTAALDAARLALPWAASALFLALALASAQRGVRELTRHAAYGAVVILLSTTSLYGSYRALLTSQQLSKPAASAVAHAVVAKKK